MRLWQPVGIRQKCGETVYKEEIFSSEPRTIAITSGKGGVGKTSIAVNLALYLANEGNKVTVFDADLGLANAEVMLGIIPPYSLYEAVYDGMPLEDIAAQGPLGVRIISGGTGFLEMANLDHVRRQQLLKMFKQYSSSNDIILIDTSAGISKNVLGFAAAAGEIIVVVTPEPTSLTDAYALIKIISNYKLHTEVGIVVNRSADRREAIQTLRKISNVVGRFLSININFLGWIPEDKYVSQAIKCQKPYFLTNPNSPAAKGIGGIARVLTNSEKTATVGFWNKLMGLFS